MSKQPAIELKNITMKFNMSKEKIENILKKKKLEISDILLMTADINGDINVIRKQ